MATHKSAIPSFFLFGEPPRAVSDRFLHLEALDDRSRPSHWTIRAHTHSDLHHIFLIADGGGAMTADTATLRFEAASLLIVPAGVAHGFVFEPETVGMVLTLAGGYLRGLAAREAAFAALFARPAAFSAPDPAPVTESLARLRRELAWTAPGHASAVESHLLAILVEALRLDHQASRARPQADRSAANLVARYREAVEAQFLSGGDIESYARQLGVSPTRLRRACQSVALRSPHRLLEDRRLLEARRLLLYSNMTVAETAYYLGFEDPAYFSRVFSRREGRSPRAFRESAGR